MQCSALSHLRKSNLNVLIQIEYEGGGGEEGDAEQGAGGLHRGLPVEGALGDHISTGLSPNQT